MKVVYLPLLQLDQFRHGRLVDLGLPKIMEIRIILGTEERNLLEVVNLMLGVNVKFAVIRMVHERLAKWLVS